MTPASGRRTAVARGAAKVKIAQKLTTTPATMSQREELCDPRSVAPEHRHTYGPHLGPPKTPENMQSESAARLVPGVDVKTKKEVCAA